jgi:DNA invertase Pin-like site-specific DNA recombinase
MYERLPAIGRPAVSASELGADNSAYVRFFLIPAWQTLSRTVAAGTCIAGVVKSSPSWNGFRWRLVSGPNMRCLSQKFYRKWISVSPQGSTRHIARDRAYHVHMKLGYARVSTTDQDAKMQIAALIEAGVAEEKIFIDRLSGATTAKERPGMAALLAYAREGDVVLCWRIDRLGRSLIDVLNTVEALNKMGVGLQSLVDQVDPSTPQGRLQMGLFAVLAEYERELINERVRAGIAAAQARGVRFGRPPKAPESAEDKVIAARKLMAAGRTAAQAARAVEWSRATLYRQLKHFGAEEPPPTPDTVVTDHTKRPQQRSKYNGTKSLPPRD